jgi:hypothetical protein
MVESTHENRAILCQSLSKRRRAVQRIESAEALEQTSLGVLVEVVCAGVCVLDRRSRLGAFAVEVQLASVSQNTCAIV